LRCVAAPQQRLKIMRLFATYSLQRARFTLRPVFARTKAREGKETP
jgi:hypothetical protein